MIRILSKPLLREWTTAQTFKPIANPTRSFSGCRRSIQKTRSTFALQDPSFSFPSSARISKACYSTAPGQVNVKTKADIPLPPTSTSHNKPKVDLRPAPKKPSQDARNGTPPSLSSPPPVRLSTAPSSTTPVHPNVLKTSSSPSSGPLDATKHDIAEATKHGILSPPPQDASRVGRVWHQLKQLFWFYWGGLKLIFVTHRRQAREIRRRAAETRARGGEAILSRYETRFLRTYDRDLVKLVPFVLTLIVLEEALPFIVLYAPGLLPSTCLLPSQRQRIDEKRRAKQVAYIAGIKAELQRLKAQGRDMISPPMEGIKSLDVNLARNVAGILSQSTWGPLFLQRRRIAKHLAYISSDDALLVCEDFGSHLKDEELVDALEERGFIVESQTSQQMREKLQWWLKGASDDKTRLRLVFQAALKESGDQTTPTI